MRIGLIGAGGISDTHARAAAAIDGVRIVAIQGANRERAAALAARYGAAECGTLEEFFAQPMDLVAIGSPSGLHADQAMTAIRRGVHVLVEKPLDISSDKIDLLIAEADRFRIIVGVCFQDRLTPDLLAMKREMEAGKIGTPVSISGRVKWYRPPEYYSGSRWRGTRNLDGGGVLMNQAIHTVDTLLWLFGPVARVSGRVATRLHRIDVEDTALALLEFESGALGVIEASTASFPGLPRRVEATGTAGTLVHEQEARPALVADAMPHQRIFEDFIGAVRTAGTPACDAREGRRSVALVEAIYRSAKTGGWETP
ncbi:MAG TPA: Gfo/Idh/MocA family oxidoreductase [Vicinamibacterales bacterium]|nr:Gfo/Idh/MocA family oxidoreductase [Vicinamibacterales bacterium]